MAKLKFFLILGFFLSLGLSKNSFAIAPTPTPTPQSNQDSYVLFYPVVAGKTEGESLYSLKLIRDRLIELFTFGNEKKSEINLKIATKRFLEAEKLLKAGKPNLAQNALDKFLAQLTKSYDHTLKAQQSESFADLLDQTDRKIQKYQIVLNQLLTTTPESQKNFIQTTLKKVAEIQAEVNQQLKAE